MRGYVYRLPPDESDASPPNEYDLGVTLPTALALWMAWEKGVMPYAGGYLNQPRWWIRAMDVLDSCHAPIQRQYMDEQYPEQAQKRREQAAQAQDSADWDDDVVQGAPFDFTRMK